MWMENMFLFWDEETKIGAVIDPGYPTKEFFEFVDKEGIKIDKILLTHGHSDHIEGIPAVREHCGKPPIYISKLEENYLTDPRFNLSYMSPPPVVVDPADVLLEMDEVIEVGNIKLKVAHSPGHSPGGVLYIGDGFIFAGDTIFKASIGRTDFPGGNPSDMMKSLDQIMTFPDETVLYVGHGEDTTVGFERVHNPYVRR